VDRTVDIWSSGKNDTAIMPAKKDCPVVDWSKMEFQLGLIEHNGKSIIGLYQQHDGNMTIGEVPVNFGLSQVSPILYRLLGIVQKRNDSLLIENSKAMGPVRIWITGCDYKWHSGPINGTFHETLRKTIQTRNASILTGGL
jgi:hypothetical protein